jgi:fatty acid amide hydrolase 2
MANSQVWCQEESVKNKTWFVRLLLAVFFGIVQIISDAIYWFIYRNKEKTQLPAIEDPILLESATSLAKKIRTQKVKLFPIKNPFQFLKMKVCLIR